MPETPHPAPTQRVVDAAARKGVALDVHVFSESTHTAEEAAAAVGAELGQIVKSLVFVAPDADGALEPVICLVSGPNRVDLARLAAVTGDADVRRATANEARELTGFTIGGIPPIGHARPVRVVMDPDLGRFQVVWAAAGTATAVFPVPPATLRMLSNAHVAPICEERRHGRRPRRARAQRRSAERRLSAAHPPMAVEPRHAIIGFPGGIRADLRWAGSGQAEAVFALTQAGGTLVDHGALVGPDPDARCRAEIRVETPAGPWTVRLASTISDDPAGLLWDTEGLLVLKYGFHVYAFEARTGELRWSHRSASPVLVVLGSSRLPHVLVQAEVETFALGARRRGRVAGRALGRGDRGRARRRAPRADELRRPGAGDRPVDRARSRLGATVRSPRAVGSRDSPPARPSQIGG